MNRRTVFTALAGGILISTTMFACGGSDSGTTPGTGLAPAAPSPAPSDRQLLSGHLSPAMADAPSIGRLDPSTAMTLLIGLPVKEQKALEAAVASVSDPQSPSYRQYITPEVFGETYGASAANYQKLVDWAKSKSFTVEAHPNRLMLQVTGAAADVEAAFQIHMLRARRADGTEFFKPDAEPSLDLSLPVQHVSGLDDYVVEGHAGATGSNGNLYAASDLHNAYASCVTWSTAGTGQSVGLYIPAVNTFLFNDIAGYAATTGLPGPHAVSTVPPNTGGTLAGGLEPVLDIEMALAMAPAAHVYVFTQSTDVAVASMAANTEIKQFSSSYFPSFTQNGTNSLNEMALQGQSFYQASGDGGAQAPGYNAVDIRSQVTVTSVGGTVLNMLGAGVSYASESAWDDSSGWFLWNGTNGLAIPSYQVGLATAANQASPTYRNIPDVAMVGQSVLIYLNGATQGVNGTSVASPLWAGFTALINQEAASLNKPSIGFANPALYGLAKTSAYDALFHDVTTGTTPNTQTGSPTFSATTGYDLTTGLGSPQCGLISALSNQPPACTASFTCVGVGFGYPLLAVTCPEPVSFYQLQTLVGTGTTYDFDTSDVSAGGTACLGSACQAFSTLGPANYCGALPPPPPNFCKECVETGGICTGTAPKQVCIHE